MVFEKYPLESQQCQVRVGSYYSPIEVVNCTADFDYNHQFQPILQYSINIEPLPSRYQTYKALGDYWATCGFNILLKRERLPIFFQVYLTSTLLVIVSWASFIINPVVVPGRMGLLITILLVLINIFIAAKHHAPTSKSLNLVDFFLVICIGEVFAAVVEYAIVLIIDAHKEKHDSSPLLTTIQGSSGEQEKQNVAMNAWNPPASKNIKNNVDKISLIIFPISFISIIITYCCVYL